MLSKKKIAKKGKNKWQRGINTQAIQDSQQDKTKEALIKEKVKSILKNTKKDAGALFTLQTTPDAKAVKKLDADRFAKKPRVVPAPLQEKLERMVKQQNKGRVD